MSTSGVVIRSGGVGDFVLTLPLLRALRERHPRLVLVSRRSYLDLIREDGLADESIDLDGPVFGSLFTGPARQLRAALAGSTVYSFLPDPDGEMAGRLRAAGAAAVAAVTSKPTSPPHLVERMFRDVGLPVPATVLTQSPLAAPGRLEGDALWLHPGSGSPAKNAPPAWFIAQAKAAAGPVILSFGEADIELETRFRDLLGDRDCEYVVMPSLFELRQLLAQRARHFVGNDSGISHLAAALGIPTSVAFLSTDPAIWCPVGPEVHVIRLAPA